VLYVGVLSTAALYPLLFGLIARIGPVRTNLYAYVSPVVAAVVGWLVLGERLAPTTVVGFLVIAVGFALVERDTLRVEVHRWRAAD
jgi:drug/metabolite transporter (DMT)-like permease